MGLTIRHATLSNVPDEGVPGEIGPSEWNQAHTVTGTDPIVILATGQSNFVQAPAFAWTPADNCFEWNWDGVDGHVGTSFAAISSTTMNVARKFAAEVAKANPTRQVYLIRIAIGNLDISHWMAGASAPDVFQNILNNVPPALAAIGAAEIDLLLWWQGEAQTSDPDNYPNDWATVHSRFVAQSWFPRATPVVLFGLAPRVQSALPRTDITNGYLQQIVRADPDVRTYIHTGTFVGGTYWVDPVHMTAQGYNRAGTMAANEYLRGIGNNTLIDPASGVLRASVLGRPGFRNLLTSGDFTTSPWQRGTTFTGGGMGTVGADGWRIGGTTDAVVDWLKTADAPTIAQAGMFTQHCLDVSVTTADTSIAAGQIYFWVHRVEGINTAFLGFGQSDARPITISFWVKSSKSGVYYVSLRNGAANRTYPASYVINAANTWERKTITVPGDTTGTWAYDTTQGITFAFAMAVGATFQGTANAWQAGNFLGASDQTNALDTIGNHFKLALVQVEEGIGASAFEELPQHVVLSRCQRYLRKSFELGVVPAQNSGSLVGAAFVMSHVTPATLGTRVQYDRMRAAPTITTYNPNAANANWRDATNGADRTVTVADISETGFNITGASGAAAALNYLHWLASAEL
jgi:hypothetical protein